MNFVPNELIHLLYVVALSFLVGLELKTYRIDKGIEKRTHIGSTRTFTFIGMLGYLFFKIDFTLYIIGFSTLFGIYAIYYFHKLNEERASIISFLLIALVYSFGPEIERFDIWLPTLVFVLIVFLLNANRSLQFLFGKLNIKEFETLGKFLLLSAVILPILPHTKIPYLNISAFKIWLVVVVISGISYGSYIAQKYIFKQKGYLLTGILGGLYSSTATTVVLAKKSEITVGIVNASIIMATAMMYIRLLLIATIFNLEVAKHLVIPMLGLFTLGSAVALYLHKKEPENNNAPFDDRNPLELGTAFVFAALFILMILLTNFVVHNYGNLGLQFLSFIIGFTDIDPFVLSLLTGKYTITTEHISTAILIASGSNDFLKAIYALVFGKNRPKIAAIWLFILGILTIISPELMKFIGV
ncbi:MgtC/SapB family protein [Nitratiruptor sp. SB155-2]|uniref:MgtC/SapB family protein n=1 Tax=Nitratiruptor sp. (strain SB155-2) TaxID=387092 RepID=UPI0001587177|nr:DUF4010 domain-containing protein [Nitratiruptor sp. SB155-2]BAF70040.1 conserved hypothetical protein [Nitratiruptor sp. SB155-2]